MKFNDFHPILSLNFKVHIGRQAGFARFEVKRQLSRALVNCRGTSENNSGELNNGGKSAIGSQKQSNEDGDDVGGGAHQAKMEMTASATPSVNIIG
jgi:hypothetical protein